MEAKKKPGWKIWLYLSPVYIVLAVLLVRWAARMNSGDVSLSKEEYAAFNSPEGEIKKHRIVGYNPDFSDGGYSVRYRPDGAESGSLPGDGPRRQAVVQAEKAAAARKVQRQKAVAAGQGKGRSANQIALESNDTRVREQMSLGNQKGYLSYAVGKVMNNPKAVGALLNNKHVVSGFMSRGTVKAATASPQGLANYLKSGGPANFMANPVVKAALNNPAIVSAVASSGIVGAMLNTPAALALMDDPKTLGDLINSNPELMITLNMLLTNPEVSGLMGKFDISGMKKY